MTQLQAIRWFADYVAETHVVLVRGDEWCVSMLDPKPRLFYPYDLMEYTEQDALFRENFIARCPIADSFADITLTILHELGHHFTRDVFWDNDPSIYQDDVEVSDEEYFAHPCEMAATDWAIAWLQESDHRAAAKNFEHDFFEE